MGNNSAFRLYEKRVLSEDEEPYNFRNVPCDRDHPAFQNGEDNRCDPSIMAGLLRSPLTDVFDGFSSYQHHPFCGPMEMKMMNCLEAYGLPKGFKKCDDWMEDFHECVSEVRRWERIKIMRKERARQFAAGERPIKYAMPPKLGSFEY